MNPSLVSPRRLRLAVRVGEAEEPAVPRDLLGVGDPVEQVADLEHGLLRHGHNLVLKVTDNRPHQTEGEKVQRCQISM